MQAVLRKLPSVDKLLQHPDLSHLIEVHSRDLLVDAIRSELATARQQIMAGHPVVSADELVQRTRTRLQTDLRPSLRPVINATGVIIHTNLGRALLSQRAQQAMLQVAATYSNLEYDLEEGQRGSRYVHAADLLCRLWWSTIMLARSFWL